jgi:hypothetical protein
MFRVPWMDDKGEMHVNRGFRVENEFCYWSLQRWVTFPS